MQIKFHGNSSYETNMKIGPGCQNLSIFMELKIHFLVHKIPPVVPKLASWKEFTLSPRRPLRNISILSPI